MASASANAASGDPFPVYKDELSSKVTTIMKRFSRWKDLLTNSNTYANDDFRQLSQDLTSGVKSAETSLSFLEKAIKMVESHRAKFEHIDEAELEARRRFVKSTRQDLQSIVNEMKSDRTMAKIARDEREALAAKTPAAVSAQEWTTSNENFIQDEQKRQQMIMRQQDENLGYLSQDVTRIGGMAQAIHVELGEQNRMLDAMSEDVEEAEEKMNFVMGKMSKLLKTKDKCQLSGIIGLTIILVIMVFLVIYT